MPKSMAELGVTPQPADRTMNHPDGMTGAF
jgi:hypothetical protein